VLYISLMLEYLQTRVGAGAPGQLLILDEPEAHVHPSLQRALVAQLTTSQNQTIATSHSPYVATAAGIARTILFSSSADGNQTATNLGFEIPQEAVSTLDRILDSTRGELLFATRLLLVEGVSEALLVPALLRSVGIDIASQHISIVPVGGTFHDQLTLLFKSGALGYRCAVLCDGDNFRVDGKLAACYDAGKNILASAAPINGLQYFSNNTTFEYTLVQPETIATMRTLLAATTFRDAKKLFDEFPPVPLQPDLAVAQLEALKVATRMGKGMFAQTFANSLGSATFCPAYILDSVKWLIS
jgi:putative ATP-dependent endonuclease of OLD family